jgi:hypothetical protein
LFNIFSELARRLISTWQRENDAVDGALALTSSEVAARMD